MKTPRLTRILLALLLFLPSIAVVSADIKAGAFTLQLPESYILDTDADHDGLNFAAASQITCGS